MNELLDVDPAVACVVGPTLLGASGAEDEALVHDTEVFGPVATPLPYRDEAHALAHGRTLLLCRGAADRQLLVAA